jgi:hypothetical protein
MTIKTIHGELNGSPGDWLVSDAQGEQYFCKNEVFDEAYEEISAEELVELQKDGVLC